VTRTHKPLRATVFKCVAGGPDLPCILLPDAICAGVRIRPWTLPLLESFR
jgi:hypothetical protein